MARTNPNAGNTNITEPVNVVVAKGDTIVDLSTDDVTDDKVLDTVAKFHDKDGKIGPGTIPTLTNTSITFTNNNSTVSVAKGYYSGNPTTKPIPTGSVTLGDQSITLTTTPTWNSTSKKIEASGTGSATVSAAVGTKGYIASISDTANVTATASGSVSAETLMNTLLPENVKTGVTIFNTAGTFTATSTIPTGKSAVTAGNMLSGSYAWVNGTGIAGTMTNRAAWTGTITKIGGSADGENGKKTIPSGYHNGSGYVSVDTTDIVASNILVGHTILGVAGSLDPGQAVTTMEKTATPTWSVQPFNPSDESPAVQFYSKFTVNAIPFNSVQTTGTDGYTISIG